jgi:hypothetical protein
MRIILLDRNALAYIRDWEWGTTGPDTKRYVSLRRLDRRSNLISPLFSLWEGRQGRKETEVEKRHAVEKDCVLIQRFFYRARTDTRFIEENIDSLPSILAQGLEENFGRYEIVISKVQADLFQPLSKSAAIAYEQSLLSFADSVGIQRTHPVVILSLALLYGSPIARKVIKPKRKIKDAEKAAYNALVDIMLVSRLSFLHTIEQESRQAGQTLRFEFFTFDEGLEEYSKLIRLRKNSSKRIDETTYATTVDIPRELFPGLDEDEFFQLGNRILQ